MGIIVAKLAGFCFGVERAVRSVREQINNKNAGIYTLGKLIHNAIITNELASEGVSVIEAEDIAGIFEKTDKEHPSIIVVRAHGITKEISEKLKNYSEQNEYFNYEDMTCPHVKKIHKIVEKHSGDFDLTMIFGNVGHPEVQGICSYVRGKYEVFEIANDIKIENIAQKKVLVVSQTTQKIAEWKKSQKIFEKYCTNALIFDTICSVTENRQSEVAELSSKVDLMLVIGDRSSSNTNKLFEISKSKCKNTYFIEDAGSLDGITVTADMNIGIAAGASTPGSIIEEVETKMSDKITNGEDFAQLLEENFKTLNTGDIVTGTVQTVSDTEVQLDIGAKATGIIASDGEKLTDLYKVGDEVTAKVVRVSDRDGVATLSRRDLEAFENWNKFMDAYNEDPVFDATISRVVKGGVIADLGTIGIFVPASLTGVSRDGDLNELVGSVHKVKVIEVNEQRRRAKGSIKAIVRELKKKEEEAFWDTIEKDMKFTGKVKSLTSYGAFVNLGPVDGMVHLTELSWKHIKNPAEVVSVGDTLDVFVLDFDREKKRISLGYKTEATNPWTIFTTNNKVEDVVNVKIVSMMPFGAFAEIIPGVDGLIHISQIANKKIGKPADILSIGEQVDAKIIDIDEENHKVSLSIRALIEPEEPEEIEVEVVEETEPTEEAETVAEVEEAAEVEEEAETEATEETAE